MVQFVGDSFLKSGGRYGPVYGSEQTNQGNGGGPCRGVVFPGVSDWILPGISRSTARGLSRTTQDQGIDNLNFRYINQTFIPVMHIFVLPVHVHGAIWGPDIKFDKIRKYMHLKLGTSDQNFNLHHTRIWSIVQD